MAMTYDDIYSLSCFGEIPAETLVTEVARRFHDNVIGGVVRAKNGTLSIAKSGEWTTWVDASSSLSASLGPDSYCIVYLLVCTNSTGTSIKCQYYDGLNTSATTKTISYSSGDDNTKFPAVFCWHAGGNNQDNRKFRLSSSAK